MAALVLKAQGFIKNGFIYPKRDEAPNFVRGLVALSSQKLGWGPSWGEPASLSSGPPLPTGPLRAPPAHEPPGSPRWGCPRQDAPGALRPEGVLATSSHLSKGNHRPPFQTSCIVPVLVLVLVLVCRPSSAKPLQGGMPGSMQLLWEVYHLVTFWKGAL